MNAVEELLAFEQYGVGAQQKHRLLCDELLALTRHHVEHCAPYARILRGIGFDPEKVRGLEDLCYLPVRLFKTLNLQSIGADEVFKVLTSSGTTSQVPSRITLDRETAQLQTKVLVSIMASFLGKQRLPMIICDSQSVLKNRSAYTARGAGIMGMATFGRDHFYALDDAMALRLDDLLRFVEAHRGQRLLFFGFTFMVWEHVIKPLQAQGVRIEPSGGVLVHSGGWKKLAERAVTNERFKLNARDCLGVASVHNFYGMVEQVGSIYVECEQGYLHAPNFAEILVRDYRRWDVLPPGSEGVIQTLSLLPRSYPGHSLLTEDLGVVHGRDDCSCGRKGTYFSILGRIPQAELRGCSDTYAESTAQSAAGTSQ